MSIPGESDIRYSANYKPSNLTSIASTNTMPDVLPPPAMQIVDNSATSSLDLLIAAIEPGLDPAKINHFPANNSLSADSFSPLQHPTSDLYRLPSDMARPNANLNTSGRTLNSSMHSAQSPRYALAVLSNSRDQNRLPVHGSPSATAQANPNISPAKCSLDDAIHLTQSHISSMSSPLYMQNVQPINNESTGTPSTAAIATSWSSHNTPPAMIYKATLDHTFAKSQQQHIQPLPSPWRTPLGYQWDRSSNIHNSTAQQRQTYSDTEHKISGVGSTEVLGTGKIMSADGGVVTTPTMAMGMAPMGPGIATAVSNGLADPNSQQLLQQFPTGRSAVQTPLVMSEMSLGTGDHTKGSIWLGHDCSEHDWVHDQGPHRKRFKSAETSTFGDVGRARCASQNKHYQIVEDDENHDQTGRVGNRVDQSHFDASMSKSGDQSNSHSAAIQNPGDMHQASMTMAAVAAGFNIRLDLNNEMDASNFSYTENGSAPPSATSLMLSGSMQPSSSIGSAQLPAMEGIVAPESQNPGHSWYPTRSLTTRVPTRTTSLSSVAVPGVPANIQSLRIGSVHGHEPGPSQKSRFSTPADMNHSGGNAQPYDEVMDSPTFLTPEAKPRLQRVRFQGDQYTPRWVRYSGSAKEGFCETCRPGKWLQLKNSAYWYHKQFFHGVSSVSGQLFTKPVETRLTKEFAEGLCHQCNQWIPIHNAKRKGTINWVLWYRHAHRCHIYSVGTY